jgi:hypothetical protein
MLPHAPFNDYSDLLKIRQQDCAGQIIAFEKSTTHGEYLQKVVLQK